MVKKINNFCVELLVINAFVHKKSNHKDHGCAVYKYTCNCNYIVIVHNLELFSQQLLVLMHVEHGEMAAFKTD